MVGTDTIPVQISTADTSEAVPATAKPSLAAVLATEKLPHAAVTAAEKPPHVAVPSTEKPPLEVAPAYPPHPLDAFVPGYPKIAARISLLPETGMFRRFGALNIRNLLYLQGDLARIEEHLVKFEWEDSQSAKGKKQYYAHSSKLLGNASVLRDGDVHQRELVEKMRDTLHLYSPSPPSF